MNSRPARESRNREHVVSPNLNSFGFHVIFIYCIDICYPMSRSYRYRHRGEHCFRAKSVSTVLRVHTFVLFCMLFRPVNISEPTVIFIQLHSIITHKEVLLFRRIYQGTS